MMKIKGRVMFGYNAQVVVDGDCGRGCGALVKQQIDRVKETLGAVSAYPVADGGYFSGEGLWKAGEREYRLVVPIWDKNRAEGGEGFEQRCFRYDAERGVWVCPKGGELKRIGGVPEKGDVGYRSYKCAAFRKCEVAHLCTKDTGGVCVSGGDRGAER